MHHSVLHVKDGEKCGDILSAYIFILLYCFFFLVCKLRYFNGVIREHCRIVTYSRWTCRMTYLTHPVLVLDSSGSVAQLIAANSASHVDSLHTNMTNKHIL